MTRGKAALAALALLTGCTADVAPRAAPDTRPADHLRLVAFDSCADALAALRSAAGQSVGPWGFSAQDVQPAAGVRAQAAPTSVEHSTTNVHEPGADEPDLVKTDGRRIVTVTAGVLRVVDPVDRRVTGQLDLARVAGDGDWTSARTLLHGDRVLVLGQLPGTAPDAVARSIGLPRPPTGTTLLLVDLSGAPRPVGRYQVDGSLVDARKTDGSVRVVVRSQPRLDFPALTGEDATDDQRLAANRKVIGRAGIDAWLPRYEWTDGTRRHTGQVPCDRLSRPDVHHGDSVLSLLTFDLGTGRLGDGDPVSVVTDGDVVYGTGTSLYVADDQRPRELAGPADGVPPRRTVERTTRIHRFDLTGSGPARYTGSGSVPGQLLNQYALSEWQGHLRVATTEGRTSGTGATSSSAVHVLRIDGQSLRPVGAVTGLGPGERIYAVRYLGGTAYVVTFRQTDPLYAVDLRNPTAPRVTGELKITGYSGYLHPVGDGRLLGIGQEADARGVRQGLQVSLFDVTDPGRPARSARLHLPGSRSTAESDPHAFLFRPADGLAVVPLQSERDWAGRGALVMGVDGSSLVERGRIAQPGGVQRSLLVGDTLWTVSDSGLKATDPVTLRQRGWIPTT